MVLCKRELGKYCWEKQFFGKNKPRSRKVNPKSKRSQNLVSKEKKSVSDDFFGRFLRSEVLLCSTSESLYQGQFSS